MEDDPPFTRSSGCVDTDIGLTCLGQLVATLPAGTALYHTPLLEWSVHTYEEATREWVIVCFDRTPHGALEQFRALWTAKHGTG